MRIMAMVLAVAGVSFGQSVCPLQPMVTFSGWSGASGLADKMTPGIAETVYPYNEVTMDFAGGPALMHGGEGGGNLSWVDILQTGYVYHSVHVEGGPVLGQVYVRWRFFSDYDRDGVYINGSPVVWLVPTGADLAGLSDTDLQEWSILAEGWVDSAGILHVEPITLDLVEDIGGGRSVVSSVVMTIGGAWAGDLGGGAGPGIDDTGEPPTDSEAFDASELQSAVDFRAWLEGLEPESADGLTMTLNLPDLSLGPAYGPSGLGDTCVKPYTIDFLPTGESLFGSATLAAKLSELRVLIKGAFAIMMSVAFGLSILHTVQGI